MRRRQVQLDITLVLLMKLLSKLVDSEFGSISPDQFAFANNDTECVMTKKNSASLQLHSASSAVAWIVSTRYLLPVLGGLLSSLCISYLRLLQISGNCMLLSSVLLAVAVNLRLMCYSWGTAATLFAWLSGSVIYGIIQPVLTYCLYRWHDSDPSMWTVLSGQYCLAAKLGELLGMLVPLLSSFIGNYFTLVSIALSIVFIAMSGGLHREPNPEPFELPPMGRMKRYFKIFSPLLLFTIGQANSRSIVYQTELERYLNQSTSADAPEGHRLVPPGIVKNTSTVVVSLALILVALWYQKMKHKQLPMEPRLQAGFLLQAAVSIALMVTSLAPAAAVSESAAVTILTVASITDGLTEILSICASFELMNSICPVSSKLLVFGIYYTVWGLSTLAGNVLVVILSQYPRDSPVLSPAGVGQQQFYIYHLVILTLAIMCSAYYRFVSYPLASALFQLPEEHPSDGGDPQMEDAEDENSPLLTDSFVRDERQQGASSRIQKW